MKKSIQETLNNLIKSTVEADALIDSNRKGIVDILGKGKSADEKATLRIKSNLEEADRLTGKVGELYEETLRTLNKKGVKWHEITLHLQTIIFAGEYPLQESGKPEPLRKTRDTNEAGRIINCFNSYRSKYSDYGVEKMKTTKNAPEKSDIEKETDKAVEEVGKDTETSNPVVFSMEQIPLALIGLFKKYENDLQAVKAIEYLADLEQVELY